MNILEVGQFFIYWFSFIAITSTVLGWTESVFTLAAVVGACLYPLVRQLVYRAIARMLDRCWPNWAKSKHRDSPDK